MNKLLIALGLLAFANAAYMRLDNTGSFTKVSGGLYLATDESVDALVDEPDYASDEFEDDPEYSERASYDLTPTYCAPGCRWNKIGNGKCNRECFIVECYFDGGDCYN